jgi:hypothetical protein
MTHRALEQSTLEWQRFLETHRLVLKKRRELRVTTYGFFKAVVTLRRTIEAFPDTEAIWRNRSDGVR